MFPQHFVLSWRDPQLSAYDFCTSSNRVQTLGSRNMPDLFLSVMVNAKLWACYGVGVSKYLMINQWLPKNRSSKIYLNEG